MREPGPVNELLIVEINGRGFDANSPHTLSLDDQERTRREAWAEKDRETDAILAEIGIRPAEASLFNVIHFGLTVPPADLCGRAAYRDYAIGGPVTEEENRTALDECLAKGWLQIVDEAALLRMHHEVQREGLLGPIYGYPLPGGVDFTHAGAKQWFRICERCWHGTHHPSFAFQDVVHDKTSHYYHSEKVAKAECDLWMGIEDVVSVKGPIPIGPWRANWWRRFPEGYRFDVEQRTPFQGRATSGGGYCSFELQNLSFDIEHAKDVLDRHNVALAEWLVLNCLDGPIGGRRIVPVFTRAVMKRFGLALTEAECFSGLEGCLSNGWVCQVDEQFNAKIHDLLRSDSAAMPVPFNPASHWIEVDFSPEGAQLYRMVTSEIFGPNWEDSLQVEYTYFREEHHYCENETRLIAVQQEYAEAGETPQSVRTVPIGPWCVYWWERFRAGFRLELTFGEP